jgi:hypothetical protein
MSNNSFQIIRTTPLLTTNMKIVISSDYELYMESFNSDKLLNVDKYKHYKISKESLLEDVIYKFYNGIPSDIAFRVKYDKDNNISYNSYDKQMDDIYFSGARYIEDQWYDEEFEYLAPLYIKKNNLPDGFIILRVDDPVIYDDYSNVSLTNKNNFRKEIIDKWKCVKLFDMSFQSNIGYFLHKNINMNSRFPNSPLNISFNSNMMSTWNGLDYNSGVYTEKFSYLDDHLLYDNPHFLFEKYITEGYKNNNVIFPNILNLKFIFNDTPCTPTEEKVYSMNRYYGFYLQDMEFIRNVTSYVTPDVKDNVLLINNIFISGDTYVTEWDNELSDYNIEPLSVSPFVEEWKNDINYFIYINKSLYNVIRIYENDKYYYKVISNDILDDYWDKNIINRYKINILFDGEHNIIEPHSNEFTIDPYYDCSGDTTRDMFGDLYLINIQGVYHVLKNGSDIIYSDHDTYNKNILIDKYYIQSDYAINSNGKRLEYWKGGSNSKHYRYYSTTGNTIKDTPISFPIYRVKFCDIKDFDFDIVNTRFSDFNYEKTEYVYTEEQKLYATEYRDFAINENYKIGKPGDIDQYNICNISSEYISSDELFMLKDNDLLDIWRKNPVFCKWGFSGSVDNADYPYKLNLTTKSSDMFNRTTGIHLDIPNPVDKNLNYFYRIGNFYSGLTSNNVYYKNQFDNIQTDFINENNNNFGHGFNLKKYIQGDVDYFNFYFKNKMYYEENNVLKSKIYQKYSVFNSVNEFNISETIFKGIKYKLYKIENVINVDNNIIDIIVDKKQNYNDYKLSVILNDIYYTGNTYTMNGIVDEDNLLPDNMNGIHIFINDKYKNVLVVLNVLIPMFSEYNNFYNISYFEPYNALYYNRTKDDNRICNSDNYVYDPFTITASNYIKSIKDLNFKHFGNRTNSDGDGYCDYVKYYYIREYDNNVYSGYTYLHNFTNSTMENVKGWRKPFPPMLLSIDGLNTIDIIKDYYNIEAVNGPSKTILGMNFRNDDINEPLARKVTNYNNINSHDKLISIKNQNVINNTNIYETIYRYSGIYEPIFNNISLFNTSDFCYKVESYYPGETNESTMVFSHESIQVSSPLANTLSWFDDTTISPNNSLVPYIRVGRDRINLPNGEINSNILSCKLRYNIPDSATIDGITINISKKTNLKIDETSQHIYVKDNVVRLRKNVTEDSPDNKSDNTIWDASNLYIVKEYGGNSDTWGFTTITPEELNKGIDLLFSVRVRKDQKTEIGLAIEVEYVNSTVYYTMDRTGYTVTNSYFIGDNYKFDTSLDDFGMINEFLYSKVNSEKNILKLDNVNDKNMYPMIDQYGYSYSNRFIFKSNWEKGYYYKTEDDIE